MFLVKCVCARYTLGCSGWAHSLVPPDRCTKWFHKRQPHQNEDCFHLINAHILRILEAGSAESQWPSVFPSVGVLTTWLRIVKSCFERQGFLLSHSEVWVCPSTLTSRLRSLTSAWNERSVSHTLIGQCHLCCPGFVETDKVVVHNLGWSHPGGFPAVTKRVALSLLVLAEVDSGGRTEESRSQRGRCWKCKGASCAVNVAPRLPLGGSRAVRWGGGVAHHRAPLHPLFLACYPQTGPAIPSQVQRQKRALQPCPSRHCISARPPGLTAVGEELLFYLHLVYEKTWGASIEKSYRVTLVGID